MLCDSVDFSGFEVWKMTMVVGGYVYGSEN